MVLVVLVLHLFGFAVDNVLHQKVFKINDIRPNLHCRGTRIHHRTCVSVREGSGFCDAIRLRRQGKENDIGLWKSLQASVLRDGWNEPRNDL